VYSNHYDELPVDFLSLEYHKFDTKQSSLFLSPPQQPLIKNVKYLGPDNLPKTMDLDK
jgi:hypothetical protein